MKLLVRLLVLFGLLPVPATAGEITVAVAANFLPLAEELVEGFSDATGHDVVLTHGSTGQIFAQIENGAPFDIFLAADALRPARLAESGRAVRTRTYALGRLLLVTRDPVTAETVAEAMAGEVVALADPLVAPYGLAATAAMERLRLDTATFQPVLVANVGQVATVFRTGNAAFAFVAASLLPKLDGAAVLDLDGLHPPIRQDAAFLQQAEGDEAAEAFWAYLFSDAAQSVIAASGFDRP